MSSDEGREVQVDDEIGAHVSAAGGVDRAPGRARAIGASVLQLFTKQPSRWAEPGLSAQIAAAFAEERRSRRIRVAGSHDSYLINLASPDAGLRARSLECFVGELERGAALGLDFLVTHPGNATDGDLESGEARNADALEEALSRVSEGPRVLLELTAGAGTSVGGSLDALARILEGLTPDARSRTGVCIDTCHAWATGYDLVGDSTGFWARVGDRVGLDRVGLVHLNDAKSGLGSHLDRHEDIGRGALGLEPFRYLLNEPRLRAVPKVLETPKGRDPPEADRRNLAVLRGLRPSLEADAKMG